MRGEGGGGRGEGGGEVSTERTQDLLHFTLVLQQLHCQSGAAVGLGFMEDAGELGDLPQEEEGGGASRRQGGGGGGREEGVRLYVQKERALPQCTIISDDQACMHRQVRTLSPKDALTLSPVFGS